MPATTEPLLNGMSLAGDHPMPENGDKPAKKPFRYRRAGPPSKTDREIITKFAVDQPHEVTIQQITALSKLLDRSPKVIKQVVEEAKAEFAGNAKNYVKLHMDSTQKAFDAGDYETSAKAAQWAIEKTGVEGVRIIEQAQERPNMPQVVIGVNLGGIGRIATEPAVDALPAPPVDPLDDIPV